MLSSDSNCKCLTLLLKDRAEYFFLFTSFKSLVETWTYSQKIANNKNTVRHKHSNITDTVHTVIIGKKFLHPFKNKIKKYKSLSGITYPKNPCRELVKF